ncbi:MAG TPA: protoporphyrinogen oxidase, partial [Candidatus Melainabacteria bacterium]|nr:protoporphyrinogen oxidase [Candidatus Melainabacteria bacterium]
MCERLGLIEELFNTNPQSRRTLVVSGGRLHPLPEGFMLMAPSRVWPVVSSPLFSLTGKLRMTMELLVPPLSDDRDESLAEFVTRRLGAEVLEKVAQPMICG